MYTEKVYVTKYFVGVVKYKYFFTLPMFLKYFSLSMNSKLFLKISILIHKNYSSYYMHADFCKLLQVLTFPTYFKIILYIWCVHVFLYHMYYIRHFWTMKLFCCNFAYLQANFFTESQYSTKEKIIALFFPISIFPFTHI